MIYFIITILIIIIVIIITIIFARLVQGNCALGLAVEVVLRIDIVYHHHWKLLSLS